MIGKLGWPSPRMAMLGGLAAFAVLCAGASSAEARVFVSVGIPLPGVVVAPPVVYAPPPGVAYAAPPLAYAAPAPADYAWMPAGYGWVGGRYAWHAGAWVRAELGRDGRIDRWR